MDWRRADWLTAAKGENLRGEAGFGPMYVMRSWGK